MSSLTMLSNKFFIGALKKERCLMEKSAIEIVPPPPIACVAIKNENPRLKSYKQMLGISMIDA
jgi:hypothetical protein